MQSRRRDSRFLPSIKKLLKTKSVQPLTRETQVALVLILVAILTTVALFAWLSNTPGFEH
jgi:hypothetical protein